MSQTQSIIESAPGVPSSSGLGNPAGALLSAAGFVLAVAGALLPSNTILSGLGITVAGQSAELLQGAVIFRIALVATGAGMLVAPRLPVWTVEDKRSNTRSAGLSSLTAILLACLLVSALIARLIQLNSGLWLDEILTLINYGELSPGQIVTTYDSENQHFLYSLLARLSMMLFGQSAWALRLPAALFGVASIAALYGLGRRVTTSREALLASALLAFSYHHLWFSQNARGYSGMLFWTLLSSWLLLKALGSGRPGDWAWYAISSALGVYTHFTSVFVIAGHFPIFLAHIFWSGRPQARARWLGLGFGFGFAGLLTLLLHALVLPQMLRTIGGSEVSVVAEWKNPLWTVMEILQGLQIGFSGWFAGAAALALVGLGLLSYARTRPVLIGLLVLPTALGAAIVVAIGHHLWPRFFFFAMGFGALVLVRGVMDAGGYLARLLRLTDEKAHLPGVVLSLVMVLISAASMVFAYGPKQDYQGALALVEARRAPGDAVVAVGLADFIYRDYLDQRWPPITDNNSLEAVRAKAERTWLIYTFPPVLSSVHPDIMSTIEQEFQLVETFWGTVRSGAVYVTQSSGSSE